MDHHAIDGASLAREARDRVTVIDVAHSLKGQGEFSVPLTLKSDSRFSGADCGDDGEFAICDIPPVIWMEELQSVTHRKGPALRFGDFGCDVVSVVPFNRAGLEPAVFGSKDQSFSGPIFRFDRQIAIVADTRY